MSKIKKKIQSHRNVNNYAFWIDYYHNEYSLNINNKHLNNMNEVGSIESYKKISKKNMSKIKQEMKLNNMEYIIERVILDYILLYKNTSAGFEILFNWFKLNCNNEYKMYQQNKNSNSNKKKLHA